MATHSKLAYYQTGIPSFDALLLPATRRKNGSEERRGLAFFPDIGFFGATFGSAGSGKSVLAMEMAAICGRGAAPGSGTPRPKVVNSNGREMEKMEFSAVYITQEAPDLIKEKITGFGWINEKNIHQPGNSGFLQLERQGLHLANFDLNPEAQIAMLRNIFDSVARSTKDRQDRFTLICFDNAETILSAAYSEVVGSSPEDKNFYKKIRDFCRKKQLHLMMFFEEREARSEGLSFEAIPQEVATSSQAYAADLVIRLGSHEFPSGYKERSIELVKAKNQFHRRGSHHFSIVSGGGAADAPPGFVIYESLATQLYKLRYPPGHASEEKRLIKKAGAGNFGIRSLDEGIKKVVGGPGREIQGCDFLRPGTVSVLVCDLDVRAAEIALHFAFRPKEPFNARRERRVAPEAVYISFLNSWSSLRLVLNGFSKTPFQSATPYTFACFDAEHISEGKLLRDIRSHIERAESALRSRKEGVFEPLRVVIDNLYGLSAKFPLIQDTEHFITALFAQLRDLNVIALVIDAVEVGEGRNPLDKSFAAGLGQNVFVLRHVEIHSRAHTAFSVVQILGDRTPASLWEIVDDGGELKARSTFKFYKNVLSGVPSLVKVKMSFHADEQGSPLDKYLHEKSIALRNSLGHSLALHRYRPDEYAHFHGAFSLARHQPLSDCHVISIDETWLEDLLLGNDLEEISPSGRYDGAVTTSHDLALFYLRSARKIDCRRHVYAIPDRNNCGVLAMCPTEFVEALEKGSLGKKLSAYVADSAKTWKGLQVLKREAQAAARRQDGLPGIRNGLFFTFCRDQPESCVSFLLELAGACVSAGYKLVDEARRLTFFGTNGAARPRANAWEAALSLFVSLLEDEDREGIAQGVFRKTTDEPSAVFSRQWFNTCFVLRGRKNPVELRNLSIHELPIGKRGVPSVVSGAWYLGILKGSAAVEAGVEAISQLTSPREVSPGEDIRKANAGIGLPVRGEYYAAHPPSIELVHSLPYRDRFYTISDIDRSGGEDRIDKIAEACEDEYPFYRMRILNYRHVMPIIWGMMVQAAKRSTRHKGTFEWVISREDNHEIRLRAQTCYNALLKRNENDDISK